MLRLHAITGLNSVGHVNPLANRRTPQCRLYHEIKLRGIKKYSCALLICAWSLSNIKIHLGQTKLSLRNVYLILRSKYFH
jgi:hypothetical protein